MFRGTACTVEDRKTGLALSLGANGEVRYQKFGLAAEGPASICVEGSQVTVELPPGHTGAQVKLSVPGSLAHDKSATMAKLVKQTAGRYILAMPAGMARVLLRTQSGE